MGPASGIPRVRGLKARLLFVMFAFILPMSLIGSLLAYSEFREEHDRTARTVVALAELKAQAVEGLIDETSSVLSVITEDPQVALDTKIAESRCRTVMSSSDAYANVGVAGLDGYVYASGLPLTEPLYVGDRPYFLRVLATGEPAVGDYQVGRRTNAPSVVVAAPLRDVRGKVVGVAYIAVLADEFEERLHHVELPSGGQSTLYDARGYVVAGERDGSVAGEKRRGALPWKQAAYDQTAPSTFVKRETYGGKEQYCAFRKLRAVGPSALILTIGFPADTLFAADARRVWLLVGGAVLASSLALVLASATASRLVVGPLRDLRSAAARLAAGDLSARVGSQTESDEIGELAAVFDGMAGSIESAVDALATSQERMQMLLEALPMAVFVAGENGVLAYANMGAVRLLAAPDAACLVGMSLLEVVAEGSETDLAAHLRSAAAGGDPEPIDARIVCSRGRIIDVELRAKLLPDAASLIVMQDVTERRQLESLKSDFVATVSHEMRTPLTAIDGYAQLLADPRHQQGEALSRLVDSIQRNTKRMTKVVTSLLDTLNVESRAYSPVREEVEPRVLLTLAIEWLDSTLAQPLSISVPEAASPLCCDVQLVTLALANLLSNALKFSGSGEQVAVVVSQDDEWTRFEVRDNGIGVRPEDAERIFDRFVQADMSSTRPYEGFGLGLYIVKTVADAHGGDITLTPNVPSGSVFTLWLPMDACGCDDLRQAAG